MVSNTGYTLNLKENEAGISIYSNLLAFLNSKAILFYLDMISTRLDETGWRWLRQYVELLPIPKLDENKLQIIIPKIEDELSVTTSLGQSAINEFVNSIYGFTEDEIIFLNSF